MKEKKIEQLLELELLELYKELGEELLKNDRNFNELEDPEKEKAGKRWFNFNKYELLEKICGSEIVAKYLNNPKKEDLVYIISGMADLISGIFISVSPITLSVLMCKTGLKKNCNEIENMRDEL